MGGRYQVHEVAGEAFQEVKKKRKMEKNEKRADHFFKRKKK